MTWFTALAFIALAYWLLVLVDTLRSTDYMLRLPNGNGPKAHLSEPAQRSSVPDKSLPLVSVIIAAKEEEASISETVSHLLSQSYPRLEIIAVNDRSNDATGLKLDELRRWSEIRKESPVPLKVIHITHLPDGWLGKNHALYQGYLQARGSVLLFTDADVRFKPNAIADAVGYMNEQQAQHLTLVPRIIAKGLWLKAFVHYFFFTLALYLRPWKANDDFQERLGMGIGAFNLITRHAYERIGTHQAIALRPDDDLQLGRKVKQARLRQRMASATGHLEVEWYGSLAEAVRGLEKNLFSGFDYRLWKALAGIAGQLLLFLFPFLGLLAMQGWISGLYGISIALMLYIYRRQTKALTGSPGAELAVLPLTILLLCWTICRSLWLTFRQGGIYWRGTFYSLKELRQIRKN